MSLLLFRPDGEKNNHLEEYPAWKLRCPQRWCLWYWRMFCIWYSELDCLWPSQMMPIFSCAEDGNPSLVHINILAQRHLQLSRISLRCHPSLKLRAHTSLELSEGSALSLPSIWDCGPVLPGSVLFHFLPFLPHPPSVFFVECENLVLFSLCLC